ncbi:MAG: ATP-grasp domain-containing protein [Candidatus Pacearchaeota archaeon]
MNEVIGYIFNEPYLRKDELIFQKVAKKKKIKLLMINTSKDLGENSLQEKIEQCDIFLNNSAEQFSLEIAKTIDALGGKVIDDPRNFYFEEDKWLFFVQCEKNKIPVPKTILLSENLSVAKKELKEMDCWPLVIKRIEGSCGEYVEKAENVNEAEKIIIRFWENGKEKLPIIAQELIRSPSYRVTLIDGKVVQTVIKKNNGWKSTGVYEKNFKKFKVDKKLKKILKKIHEISKIKICGIDLLKKGDEWVVLEINSQPGLDFFENEREKLIGKILDFLKKEIKKSHKKPQEVFPKISMR